MREEKKWFSDHLIQRTAKALENNGFKTVLASDKNEALKEVLQLVPEKAQVGIGGSVTVREVDLVSELSKRGNDVLENWSRKVTPEEDMAIRKGHLTCDVFITSSNAITEDGKLVNIDGMGNRVASMIFGPKKVIVIAGINKIVKDIHVGIERIRHTATPMNVKRMGGTTPCVIDVCDLDKCQPPNRHCHVITIIEKKPIKTDTTIILVKEELGF
ncbi:MAG: lactate utilization protein [Candidatus Bathyarchaeia archaeon]|jgi:L-lactate utilization protein LutB|nr:lactate utilization protein [Candidatus Bathyarchaeota archaeon]